MAKVKKSENVPKNMQTKYDEIAAITDDFAKKYLDDDYAKLIRYAIAALARKRPSPLTSGKANSWACGITHALGMVNFLYDASFEPHIKAFELYKAFGVGQSTALGKSKQVRDLLDMHQMDPDWSTQVMIKKNPLNSMVMINGLPVDARDLPKEVQELLHQAKLLPVIPDESNEDLSTIMNLIPTDDDLLDLPIGNREPVPATENDVFCFDVALRDGPVTDEFIDANPYVARTIEILGKQTLADFHKIIFKAFDREEEHMYEFQVRGDYPNDPKAERYVLPVAMDDDFGEKPKGSVKDTTILSLKLALDDVIGYWFDFGDDWWHQINLIEVKPKPSGRTKYPRITEREGASPPQYPNFDEE